MSTIDIRVPDIGDFKDVPVIEVLVKAGDTIAKETPLVVLESEKASMEVPSSASGTVADVKVKPGDKVSEGSVIITLKGGDGAAPAAAPTAVEEQPQPQAAVETQTIELKVPDIGDFKDVPVVDVLVKPGDAIAKEAPLVVLESEKASMEVPASAGGTVVDVRVKPGDKVSQGSVIATLQATGAATPAQSAAAPAPAQPESGPSTPAAAPSAATYAQDDKKIVH